MIQAIDVITDRNHTQADRDLLVRVEACVRTKGADTALQVPVGARIPISSPTLDSVERPGLGYEVKPAPRKGHGFERRWVLCQGVQNEQTNRRPPPAIYPPSMRNYKATCQIFR